MMNEKAGEIGMTSSNFSNASGINDPDNISTVSAGFCRNKSFKPFAFLITDDGLPQIIEGYAIEMSTKKKRL